MSSYAEKHGLNDLKETAEHMLREADEYLVMIPDPEREGKFVLIFKANDPNQWGDALDEMASAVLANGA